MTAFVELVEIAHATGESMFNALNDIGFGSDGVSAMVGEWNSVWSGVREVSPHCVLIKCMQHSLTLCVQHVFTKMSSNLGFMLKKIPLYLGYSLNKKTLTSAVHSLNFFFAASLFSDLPTKLLVTNPLCQLVGNNSFFS